MIAKNNKISLKQLEILLLLDAFSLGSLALSRRAVEFGNTDAWLVILVSGLMSLIYGYLVVSLCNKFPGKSIIGMTEELFSKPIAKIFAFFLLIRFTILIALEVRIFGEIIKNIILPRTPIEVIIISMIISLGYMVLKGYEYRAKLAEVLIYVVFIPVIFIFLFASKGADVTNMLPMFTTNPSKLFIGAYVLSNTFKMIEVVFFSNLFINTNKGLYKTVFRATLLSTLFNICVTVVVICVLTPKEMLHHLWPIITMANGISFPGLLIERQELLFVIFMINSIFIMISGQTIVSSILIKDIFKSKKSNLLFLVIVVAIYQISLIPDNIALTYDILEKISLYSPIIFMVIVPLVYMFVAKIRKKGMLNG